MTLLYLKNNEVNLFTDEFNTKTRSNINKNIIINQCGKSSADNTFFHKANTVMVMDVVRQKKN